ncbi:hypothetical protein [Paenibacillus sp. 1P07SE]|uniref:hypothetical protein n=1 Tax=Paenibacillus sp. 1P07SE TaxID=3132209 RepID=UPI0039A5635B
MAKKRSLTNIGFGNNNTKPEPETESYNQNNVNENNSEKLNSKTEEEATTANKFNETENEKGNVNTHNETESTTTTVNRKPEAESSLVPNEGSDNVSADDGKHRSDTQQEKDKENNNSVPEQQNGTVKLNSKTENKKTKSKLNNDAVVLSESLQSFRESENEFLKMLEVDRRKKTVEETHTRDTFLIENHLLDRLNRLAQLEGKGFKKKFINYVIEKEITNIERAKGIYREG